MARIRAARLRFIPSGNTVKASEAYGQIRALPSWQVPAPAMS